MCEVPFDAAAVAAVHGALGVDGRVQEAVGAAGVLELRGGQRGQDTGSGRSSGARWDEAMVSPLESRCSEDGVCQDTG